MGSRRQDEDLRKAVELGCLDAAIRSGAPLPRGALARSGLQRRFGGGGGGRRFARDPLGGRRGGPSFLANIGAMTTARSTEAAFVDENMAFLYTSSGDADAGLEHVSTAGDITTWGENGTPTESPPEEDHLGGMTAVTTGDDNGASYEYHQWFPGYNTTLRCRFMTEFVIKKEASDQGAYPEFLWNQAGGAFAVQVNPYAGTSGVRTVSGFLDTDHELITHPDNSSWWRLRLWVRTASTGGFTMIVIPARTSVITGLDPNLTGTVTWVPESTKLYIEQAWARTLPDDVVRKWGHKFRSNGAFTNYLQDSTDIDAWTKTFATVALNGVAPDTDESDPIGAWNVLDADAANYGYVRQVSASLTSGNQYTLSCFLEKDSDTSRFPEFQLVQAGNFLQVQFNTSTGAFTTRGSSGITVDATRAREVTSNGRTWWQVSIVFTAAGTAVHTLTLLPAATTTWGAVEATATGSVNVCHFCIQDGGYATPPIRTFTGGAVTVDGDDNALAAGAWNGLKNASGKVSIRLWLDWPSTDTPAGGTWRMVYYIDANRYLGFRYSGAVWELRWYANRAASAYSNTSLPASSVGDELLIELDFASGDLSITNVDTSTTNSDATPAGAGDWDTADTLDCGHNTGASQIDGVVELPRAA